MGPDGRHRITLSNTTPDVSTTQKYRIPPELIKALDAGLSGASRPVMTVPGRLMAPKEEYVTHRVDAGGLRQLLIRVMAVPEVGPPVILQALVDTGAETNLIRTGLLPQGSFLPARDPLCLVTADGKRMPGGTQEVTLRLEFGAEPLNREGEATWSTTATFHDAGIHVDAILSYPWLNRARLGVFPHLNSLVRLSKSLGTELTLTDWKGDEPTGVPLEGPPGWEEDPRWVFQAEKLPEAMSRVRAMGLRLPAPAGVDEECPLGKDEEVMEVVARQLGRAGWKPTTIGSVVQSSAEILPEGFPEGRVAELRKQIHKEYNGRVLRADVPPEWIIKRGPQGEGKIVLRPGSEPRASHPIRLQGEKLAAMKTITEGGSEMGRWSQGGRLEQSRICGAEEGGVARSNRFPGTQRCNRTVWASVTVNRGHFGGVWPEDAVFRDGPEGCVPSSTDTSDFPTVYLHQHPIGNIPVAVCGDGVEERSGDVLKGGRMGAPKCPGCGRRVCG